MNTATSRKIDDIIEGGNTAPLHPAQRANIAIVARNAFDLMAKAGALGDAAEFETWRHEQVMVSSERSGLKQCSQIDYAHLYQHFAGLVAAYEPDPRREAHWRRRAESMRQRDAMGALSYVRATLDKVLADDKLTAALGDPERYAKGLAQRMFRRGLGDLNAREMWRIVITIRNRGNQKARKQEAAVRSQE